MRQGNFGARPGAKPVPTFAGRARLRQHFTLVPFRPGIGRPISAPPENGPQEDDMTPQERQMMAELFNRLSSLENSPRDPDAEAMIREGFRRAPNAAYALTQTVLLQDEALKAANARIQQYEQGGAPQEPQQSRGFLDSMR